MKRIALSALVATGLVSAGTFAAPIVLPNAPIFLQYVDAEQFSATNDIGNAANPITFHPAAGTEGTWGILQVTSMQLGTVLNPLGSDIQGGGPTFFSNGQNGGNQVLGIFHSLHTDSVGVTKTTSTGGVIDLYWWDVNAQNVGVELSSATNLPKRTAVDQYTGFTCVSGTPGCTFLARLDYVSGQEPGSLATITTPANPFTGDGTSRSYLNVDTSVVGAWTGQLDTNFFTRDPNNNLIGFAYPPSAVTPAPGGVSFPSARDIRLDNNFSHGGATAWNVDIPGTPNDIVGLQSNDPARTFIVSNIPEPGSLALLGLAFAAIATAGRRRCT